MTDDTTKPKRKNEIWSLLAMLAVIAIAAGVIWKMGWWEKLEAPSPMLPEAALQKAAKEKEAELAMKAAAEKQMTPAGKKE